MERDSFEFLKNLVNAPGPSGFEQAVQKVFRERVSPYVDDVKTDILGSVIATRHNSGTPRIMLAGHADEIGFLIRYIGDDGMLYFGGIGGHDAVVSVAQRVRIHTVSGAITGVLGRKAVHLMDQDERGKAPKLEDLWIDIGAKNKQEAEKLVCVGDCATYSQELEILQGDICTARSFDNKMGVFLVAETMRLLMDKIMVASVSAVSNVQEEVGIRGARTSSYEVDPLIGIATDVCHAMDFPGADKKKVGDIKLGAGPVITKGSNINPKVFALLVQTAKDLEIPYQVEAIPGGTGTDANAMQLSKSGVATGLVSVPLRYMHTPCEVMDLEDIVYAAELMAGFCERVTPEMDWTPE